jgi:chorismate mutase
MIETHCDPENAWSDARQQITPASLAELLQSLIYRRPQTDDLVFNARLEALRRDIDGVDAALLELLAKRLALTAEVGAVKKDNDITILQPQRWAEIVESRLQHSGQLGMDAAFITRLLQLLHQESINTQVKMFQEARLNASKTAE